jgi:hypothetical protein
MDSLAVHTLQCVVLCSHIQLRSIPLQQGQLSITL